MATIHLPFGGAQAANLAVGLPSAAVDRGLAPGPGRRGLPSHQPRPEPPGPPDGFKRGRSRVPTIWEFAPRTGHCRSTKEKAVLLSVTLLPLAWWFPPGQRCASSNDFSSSTLRARPSGALQLPPPVRNGSRGRSLYGRSTDERGTEVWGRFFAQRTGNLRASFSSPSRFFCARPRAHLPGAACTLLP